MHNVEDDPDALQRAIDAGYEKRDLPYGVVGKAIFVFFIMFGVFAVIGLASMWLTYKLVRADRNPFVPQAVAEANKPKLAPLQTNVTAHTDIKNLRLEEAEKTEKYKVNEDGTFQIPVHEAMEKLSERGLQSAPSPVTMPQAAPQTTQPAEVRL